MDWLEVRENSKTFFQGGPRYCCNYGPDTVVSHDSEILVIFHSSSNVGISSNGFKANYQFIEDETDHVDQTIAMAASSTIGTQPTMHALISATNISSPQSLATSTASISSVDLCRIHHPCLNGGRCENLPNGFICHCPHSFTGLRCEVKQISKCLDVKCQNNGFCMENLGVCLCQNGFTGNS